MQEHEQASEVEAVQGTKPNTALAIVRFSLLSAQLGAAVGFLTFLLMCFRSCGGYWEVFFTGGLAIFSAITVFIAFMTHYALNIRKNPKIVTRQALMQWIWLGVTGFILMLFF